MEHISQSPFDFPPLITIPSLIYTYVSPPPESCDKPDRQPIIISPVFFVCDPAFPCLQRAEEDKTRELTDGRLEHQQNKPSVTHQKEQEIQTIQGKIREVEAETDFLCHETKRNQRSANDRGSYLRGARFESQMERL